MGLISSCVDAESTKDFVSAFPSIKSKRFDKTIAENRPLLIHFYLSYGETGQKCRDLDGQLRHAYNHLQQEKIPLEIYRVNCSTELEINNKCQIMDYPSLFLYKEGEENPIEYKGGLSGRELINWLNKQLRELIVEIPDLASVNKLTSACELTAIYFGEHAPEQFKKAASKFDEIVFAHVNDSKVASALDASNESFVLYSHQRSDFVFKDSNWDHLEDAIDKMRFPEIYLWDKKTHDKIWGHEDGLYLFINEKGPSYDAQKLFKQIHSTLEQPINFITVDSSSGNGKELTQLLDVEQFPSLILMSKEKLEYIYVGAITEERVLQFISNWRSGSIKPVVESEGRVVREADDIVLHIVARSFEKTLHDIDQDLVICFYDPSQTKSNDFLPAFCKLASDLQGFTQLKFGKMNMQKNKVDGFKIKGDGPMVFLFKKADSGESPIEFGYKSEELNENGLKRFLKDNLGLYIETEDGEDQDFENRDVHI